ncbi:hypothetical protein BV898_16194 [Hypsibius exemplaris]|uniref:Uncharacterized protein n=1 Tax=Hypsibius exemplaris TaxID=2072580 RepID=A0A9X6NCS1_HYPEX|nr:hypothetical protein BV898_16194 [Hypsibius exemplaris]
MIGCMCVLDSDETLPPDTVITGENLNRRNATSSTVHRRALGASDQITSKLPLHPPDSPRENGFYFRSELINY